MEFSPRALGNRTILASPVYEDMKLHLNLKIKLREEFRPFAPVIKADKMQEWFSMENPSKYMVFTHQSSKKKLIPSCVHEDFSARVQTLAEEDNKLLYETLSEFETYSQTPILINTSFNRRGEPIVESPLDAVNCFFRTGMDILILEDFVVEKRNNSSIKWDKNIEYELD